MHYNRTPLLPDELDPWESLCLNIDMRNLAERRPHALVNINGATILHQHEITFLTGASHCRAHAFAKMLAGAVIGGAYPFAQSVQVARHDGDDPQQPPRVLWIDTVHSFYTCCGIIDDIKRNFSATQDNFRFVCLDALGTFAECYERLLYGIMDTIRDFNPSLVIIDDLDHLATDCGYNLTTNFYLMVREYLDHHGASFLCIGYNLINSTYADAGPASMRISPLLNPLYFSYSGSRGFSYKLNIGLQYNFNTHRYLSLNPQMGYNFKQQQFYYTAPLRMTYNPKRRAKTLMYRNSRMRYSSWSTMWKPSIGWKS